MVATEKSKSKTSRSKREQKLNGAIYFLEWTRSSLTAYTKLINDNYLNPLIEHCTKMKVIQDTDSTRQVGDARADVENKSLLIRLRAAATRVTDWEGERPQGTYNKVCIAELAAMHRLRKLVQMSVKIEEMYERIQKWLEAHIKEMSRHSRSADVVPHVQKAFELVCAVAEVFSMEFIDRNKCKDDFKDAMRALDEKDYKTKESEKFTITDKPKEYIIRLEERINHYRTAIHLLCASATSLILIFSRDLGQELVDIRTREVEDILLLLPPMYVHAWFDKLSPFNQEMLSEPPRNKRSYPLVPKEESMRSMRSGVERIRKDRTEKAAKKKGNNRMEAYNNPSVPLVSAPAPSRSRASVDEKSAEEPDKSKKSAKSVKSKKTVNSQKSAKKTKSAAGKKESNTVKNNSE